ncbi:MAG: cbb3-type cytochrome c oxidase N-terminal domain-containing protein [Chitinophagaceae bacterium]
MKFRGKKRTLRIVMTGSLLAIAMGAFADGPPAASALNNSVAIILLFVAIALLLAIALLAFVLTGVADVYATRFTRKESDASTTVKMLSLLVLSLVTSSAFAQEGTPAVATAVAANSFGGLSATAYYGMLSLIGLEVVVILVMLLFVNQLLPKEKPAPLVAVDKAVQTVEKKESFFSKWWKKINDFRPANEEATLLMDHDYDGIHELDNKLPPWWLYGFYACIIFSFIYLYRFHVSHSAPGTIEEYNIAMAEAETEKLAYLKTAANNVDENSIKLLTDASALAEGQKIFVVNCAACHGAEGQGVVGPNLTDDYWLHKGSVKDIFKTIKYGYPDKGMKSWNEDFSPLQMAALASYVKSLHGTKPANPKEPQGDLFKDEPTVLPGPVDSNINRVANK